MYNNNKSIIRRLFSGLILAVLLTLALIKPFPIQTQSISPIQPKKVMDELPPADSEVTPPYEIVEQLNLEDGTEISAHHIISPSTPPIDIQADRAASIMPTRGAMTLPDFPSYDWVFGCGAVSGAMIAAYQDRNGYPNLYTGPTNGGLMPTTDTSWPTWSDGSKTYPSNPLIASKNGLDGRIGRGSIENYWVESGSTANDPYITNGWTEHTWGDAIGDYMKTSQSAYGNVDGDSTIYRYTTSSNPLSCDDIEDNEYYSDLTLGRKQFYEAKGYTVTTCYNQKTDNEITGGFSLADYQAEINAGWPVLLHLRGHFVVGYGYSGSTIYIRDTWDSDPTQTYTMTWGEDYLGMDLMSVSIVHLEPPTTPTFLPLIISRTGNGTGTVTSSPVGINCGNTCQATFAEGTQVTLLATPNSGSFFSGWSGACSGTAPTCVVTMTQASNVTATFTTTVAETFFDVPSNHWAYSWIDRLYRAGITSGCGTNPLRYCPDYQVTRAEMAKFLLKGIYGPAYEPPALQPSESTGFNDVPWNHWAARWIKKLALDGITSGCGPGIYCPEQKVTRAEMAKFMLKAKYGASYVPNVSGTLNLIQDPSFEAYTPNPYWTEYSYNFGTPLCTIDDCGDGAGTAGPRSGDVWAWFGGTLYRYEEGYVVQNVIIPVGANTLEFYFWIGAATTSSSPNDIFTVSIGNQEIFSANGTQTDLYSGYTLVTLDISQFADGQVHPIKFYSFISKQLTNFNLDDIAIYGSGITSPTFTDVPLDFWASQWIEKLYLEGITSGCGYGNYCPNNPVSRAEMAKFLTITFNLPE